MNRKPLSLEDRVLWAKVARSTTPLSGKEVEDFEVEEQSFAQMLDGPPAPVRASQPVPPVQPKQQMRQPTGLGSPTHQKLAKGRLPIEGKVDLHGLTQSEAYTLLLSFLHRARSDGRRHVLVVTGKGLSSGGNGVLRRAVPGWFSTQPFRALVSGYEEAARGHGGSGALYVRLRKEGV